MTKPEQQAYELVCRQLDDADRRLAAVERILRSAIANELNFNDCPRTVEILTDALSEARRR